MRKIILNLAATLDGFIEGANGELDWCILEEDMHFDSFLESIDTIFYGRVSYDQWGNYQPDTSAPDMEKQIYAAIQSKKKFVFSSQSRVDDKATFISTDVAAMVEEIRNQPGEDIWLYGGAKLISMFIENGLVDEYMISVHPTALGAGKPLFDISARLNLVLTETRVFKSGVVQLIYTPGTK
ncbi:MAG TPA: dihydrofolate reductase family protein [Chitinophaga sp.]|uniref:dihydrofolate reductase family protein n=1 Tax=Chitinophaga sp. TaxID=1869181 RepID=UPI002BA2A79C|nr:dihydrofolate reductase family protein [Chitinophaga sp.]HVI49270.1 dihydrofolate reductase family protein [Chitinophaga sp.]